MTNILSNILILFAVFSCNNNSQKNINTENAPTGKVEEKQYIKSISGKLDEISGLMIYDDLFWGFNDSGGKAEIYAFNKEGKIKRTVELEDAKNKDWEAIAQDEKHIYIGDFGNNWGSRKNLTIYKVDKKDLKHSKEQKVKSKKIKISYSDQESFTFLDRSTPHDCESLIEFNGSLYIFSKNWNNYTTTMYKVPTKKGEYKLTPADKYNIMGLITGADISPDKTKLALVGYNAFNSFFWIFSDFKDDKFLKGKAKFYPLKKAQRAQTEGICFKNNSDVLISCENSKGFHQQVFLMKPEQEKE